MTGGGQGRAGGKDGRGARTGLGQGRGWGRDGGGARDGVGRKAGTVSVFDPGWQLTERVCGHQKAPGSFTTHQKRNSPCFPV
jgi:hypothetical protein